MVCRWFGEFGKSFEEFGEFWGILRNLRILRKFGSFEEDLRKF
jgi:hypothetical protein